MRKFNFSAVSKRVPFKFVSHMSGEKEHLMMHHNEDLNINCETVTKRNKRSGEFGKSSNLFYVAKPGTRNFKTLAALLNAVPLLGQLAEVTYPEVKK